MLKLSTGGSGGELGEGSGGLLLLKNKAFFEYDLVKYNTAMND